MFHRFASLRLRLLLAMLATAIVGLFAAYFGIAYILTSDEQAADRRQAHKTAELIATSVAKGTSSQFLRTLRTSQRLLANDQILIYRGGQTVFVGQPVRHAPLEVTVTSAFPGGRVVLRKYEFATSSSPLTLTAIAAAVAALVILIALATASGLLRTVQRPLARAIAAADRVAAGDLSARMEVGAPEEFARLSRAFDGMAAQLEVSGIEQRRLLADIAHEIATPVSGLSSLASALADGTAATEAARAEAAALIEGEVSRVQALLDDLRQLTRLDLAEPVSWERVELQALCSELAARFQHAAVSAGIELHLEAVRLPVRSNRRLLEAVLVNFLTNALRHTPAGGRVLLRVERRPQEAVVSVADTGIGIGPEHRSRIFDRLYRVEEARDRASGGSGLGLAIAQRAAGAIGGRVEVESEVGRGSEFRIVLPRSRTRRG